LPPSFPFAANFLSRAWPVLLEFCSLPRDPAKISTLLSEVSDPESLVSLAEAHGVAGHLATAFSCLSGPQIPSSFTDSLRARQRANALSDLAMAAELFRILQRFRQSEIECVVVKGPVLSLRAYGELAVRQYADLDLLLRQKDIPRSAEILVAAGYDSRISGEAIRRGKIPGEYRFRAPGTKIILELHTERTLRYFPSRLPIEKYFQRKTSLSFDGRVVPALSAEDEFILISVHGATHFWERLMWISDVAATVHNHPELDWEAIGRSAAEVGAERMVRLALLLAQYFLRVRVPAEMKKAVEADSACIKLARNIETWLPFAGYAPPTIARRALFRFRMPGSITAGAAYLTRLSLSTTEEDWSTETAGSRSSAGEILSRPFRLAKKYRRNSNS
jgi:hypothetical protein